jgi:hypothetical protein
MSEKFAGKGASWPQKRYLPTYLYNCNYIARAFSLRLQLLVYERRCFKSPPTWVVEFLDFQILLNRQT